MDGQERETRNVLVCFGERKRVLAFSACRGKRDGDGLLVAVLQGFSDIIGKPVMDNICLQIRDENWGGEFVDLLDQGVPDRSVVRLIVVKQTELDGQVCNNKNIIKVWEAFNNK